MQCPKCQCDLEYETDGQHNGSIASHVAPGYILYCPDCGYEERHIAGRKKQILNEGISPCLISKI